MDERSPVSLDGNRNAASVSPLNEISVNALPDTFWNSENSSAQSCCSLQFTTQFNTYFCISILRCS